MKTSEKEAMKQSGKKNGIGRDGALCGADVDGLRQERCGEVRRRAEARP